MITFTSGMPGDGKSYFIMTEIERELVEGSRIVVTNVELNIENVAQSLHEKFGRTFDLHSRYVLLTPDQTKTFWLYRGTHELTLKPDGRCDFMSLDRSQPGVCYVIDELHEHFNARAWAKTGADALTYASQHRKLGDSVFFISQRAKQVDSQLRALAGAYVYMRNLANRTLKVGPFVFRFGRTLIAKAYPDEWNKGGTEPVVMWTKSMKVDPKGYGAWYDTAAGVGVKGAAADTLSRPARGLPWQFGLVGLVLVAFLVWFVPKLLGAGIFSALSLGHAPSKTFSDDEAAAIVQQLQAAPVATPAADNPVVTTNQFKLERPMIRTVQVARNGFVTLTLTNGLQVTSADGIELLGREGFRYQGRVYPLP